MTRVAAIAATVFVASFAGTVAAVGLAEAIVRRVRRAVELGEALEGWPEVWGR